MPHYALVLTGGGARGAYQAGVMCYVRDRFPEVRFPIKVGVSAGAVNAAHLAGHPGVPTQAALDLAALWTGLTVDDVFQSRSSWRVLRRTLTQWRRGSLGVAASAPSERGLLDTTPLRDYLTRHLSADPDDGTIPGVYDAIERGDLKALALATTSYTTGQSVTWVQGIDIEGWERPNRISVRTALTVDHVLASSAIPIVFPAVRLSHRQIGTGWYGDGGIRLTAPLSPAIHLGADRIFAVSTRYDRSQREAAEADVVGYPPPAQVVGLMMNAVFLDMLDQDALTLRRLNRFCAGRGPEETGGLRPVKLLLMRPSQDLGKLAGEYPIDLGGALGLLTNGLGSDETKSPDWLSLLLFNPDYTTRLVDLGYADAKARQHEIEAFLSDA